MFGGIPTAEIDALGRYWAEWPNLRASLFEEDGTPYARLGTEDIAGVLADHSDVAAFKASFARSFEGFRDYLVRELVDDPERVSIAEEEPRISSEIFERLDDIGLIDRYAAYQTLDDTWQQVAIDLEIIQTEGFDAVTKVDPNMDRIELGTQSLKEYRGFAEETEDVQETEDTQVLKGRLTSIDPADTLIVTSIQKMSRIHGEDDGITSHDIEVINGKRIVFIVDECHRSVFGDMLATIKATFPNAIFFGFTGTPIQDENSKKNATTAMVFGDELHRYSIADGIRDRNVLGFDPYMPSPPYPRS